MLDSSQNNKTNTSSQKWSISFIDSKKETWIKEICRIQQALKNGLYNDGEIIIRLNDNITPAELQPFHLVLLACLTKFLRKFMRSGKIIGSPAVVNYLQNDIHLDLYITNDLTHIKSESSLDLNLWKVSSKQSLFYSSHVSEYLKNRYFRNKDLSLLRVILDELYANIADHSLSEETAYSFIHYDEQTRTINIAFCDFGIGIPESLRKAGHTSKNGYIQLATNKGISARSNSHNKGFGLDTVVSSIADTDNNIWIISGNELFISYGKNNIEQTVPLPYDFSGTLIYFDLPISSFEDEEYINEFEF